MIHRDLHDAVDFVFNGVLGGEDLGFHFVHLAQGAVERSGLTGTGRSGDNKDAVRSVDELTNLGEDII